MDVVEGTFCAAEAAWKRRDRRFFSQCFTETLKRIWDCGARARVGVARLGLA